MTNDDMARKAVEINFVILVHGVQCTVGFEWHDTFIHDPFADPQYGAFPVDPVQQYGEAYLGGIFVTDPATALSTARRQLRDAASQDLAEYCAQHHIERGNLVEISRMPWGLALPESGELLEALTDDQVVTVWAGVDTDPRFCRLARE